MNIKPHIGFGLIKFGMTMKDVAKILGKQYTQEIEQDPEGGEVHTMVYQDLFYSLTFSSDDDLRLGSITFYAEDTSVMGLQLIGLDEDDFLEIIATKIEDIELDDHFEDVHEKDYVSDKYDISFWIQEGFVYSISIFPKYANDGTTVLWP